MSDQLAVQDHAPSFVKASDRLAHALGIPVSTMNATLKAQCFRGAREEVSDAQLAAFISIANDMGVNPLLPGMLYAYPSQGAIFPIMGPDGVFKKLSEHPDIDSWETTVFPEDIALPPTHAITKIYRKGRERPVSYTAVFSEWKVGSNPNWNSRPRHMLSIRSLKQAARQIIHGLPGDEDDRIIAEINVTPQEEAPKRPPAPPREKKGAAAVKENADKAGAIEAHATPVPETKVEEKPADKPVEQPAKTEPKTALIDGEQFTAVCEVESFTCRTIPVKGQPTPSVIAKVKGDFIGEIIHMGGATLSGDKLTELPEWQITKPVKLALKGQKRTDGRIAATVESIAFVNVETKPVEPAEEF